uniref:BHLH domain-containing protein n=1 Tax=Mesocestoides corti TaxID=53468 RepID=A0A5K3FCM9_MESCO
MILFTLISRIADGLPLVASVKEDTELSRNLVSYQNQAKLLIRRIVPSSPPRCSLVAVERRRRDYINSQITRLSGLLPVDMYRDVDGRRNKGTVLRLSVNYILELRQAVAHTASLRQETAIARQLIPLLLSHIQTLESIIKEVQMLPGKRLGNDACGSTTMLDETPRAPETAYEGVLEAWRTAMTTNLARAAAMAAMVNNGADASRENKVEAKDLPLMDNVQAAFVGRPSTTVGAAGSPYLPNAIFMGGGVCKLEEGEGGCYEGDLAGEHITGSTTTDTSCGPHPPPPSAERTTDGFFDSNNAPKFDITIMQLAAGGGSNDCGDPMQVSLPRIYLPLTFMFIWSWHSACLSSFTGSWTAHSRIVSWRS